MESSSSGDVVGRLRAARERLDAKDRAGAVAIYEEVLNAAGGRADVLVTISGDLGSTGHVVDIIDLIGPRYDARRHGPATGVNLVQAYLAVRDPGAAQHVLDLLFDLNRPELEERLYGFSNAIAELLLAESSGEEGRVVVPGGGEAPPAGAAKIGLVSISKPIWFYGLEAAEAAILPAKPGKLRRVAFAPLALLGPRGEPGSATAGELVRLSHAFPMWLAEVFYFSPAYSPYASVAFIEEPSGGRRLVTFDSEWTSENLLQLVESTKEGLDYIFTGTLRHRAGDYELALRLWEVKKFRQRKEFLVRWTPATAEAELDQLRIAVCQFMEWSAYPPGEGLAYPPGGPSPRHAWLDALGGSLNLFLADKQVLPKETVGSIEEAWRAIAVLAPASAIASLAWITLKRRAETLGLPVPPPPALADDPVVRAACGS